MNNQLPDNLLRNYWPIGLLLFIKAIIHLGAINHYDYFIDEYYYLASTDRLALGYVDHPPLSIWILAAIKSIFGNGLAAIRLVPVFCGCLVLFYSTKMAKLLGANHYGQFLTGLAVLFAPMYFGINKFYSMNSLEHLFWTMAIYLIICIIIQDRLSLWIQLGLVLGLGLLNKHSVLFLGFAFFVALLLTPNKSFLFKKGPYICALIAGMIFLPNLYWQVENNWPTMEFMHNAHAFKNYFQLGDFLTAQLLEMNIVAFPLWLTGLFYFLLHSSGRKYQIFGWMYLTLLILFILSQAKSYYLSPMYPVLFAGGATGLYMFFKNSTYRKIHYSYSLIITIAGLLFLPLSLPLLSPQNYIKYESFLGLKPPKMEKHESGLLPQHFADMFGWKEIGEATWDVFNHLPNKERNQTIVIASNYGYAGAIEFYASSSELDLTGSTHNSYYDWGAPVPKSGMQDQGKYILAVGYSRQELEKYYNKVIEKKRSLCKYCLPQRQISIIYQCTEPKMPFAQIWKLSKKYI